MTTEAAPAVPRGLQRTDVRLTRGLLRSLLLYYGAPFKIRRLAGLYRRFVAPGELCFDVGAHVGDRTRALLRLGARVVAVEPQPPFAGLLRRLYGKNRHVTVVEAAVAANEGHGEMYVSRRTPTVSSLSRGWVEGVRQAPRFAGVTWDENVPVAVTTLDSLVTRFGRPAFIKLDVEGGEPEALAGLSTPVRALSFEYVPAMRAATRACFERLDRLARYEYNWTVGESPRLRSPEWLPADRLRVILEALPDGAKSGDVYARRARDDGTPRPT